MHSTRGVEGVEQKSWDEARETTYRARTFQWVDPLKDTQQNETLVNMGAKSVKMVAEELGIDIQDVLDDGKELAEAIENIGPEKLKLVMSIFGKNATANETAGDSSDNADGEGTGDQGDDEERGDEVEQSRIVHATAAA